MDQQSSPWLSMSPDQATSSPQQPAPYPTMPNAYGLGNQQQPAQAQNPQQPQGSNIVQPNLPTNEGSRGFNPFSLQGPANTRNPWGA